jgi:hypothetical protein
MEKNLNNIAKELYRKLANQIADITLRDSDDALISSENDIANARTFLFNYENRGTSLGSVLVSLSTPEPDAVEPDAQLIVTFSNDIADRQPVHVRREWYAFLKALRDFSKKHLINFDTRDITRTNVSQRNTTESIIGENMTSKLWGSSKTSYQQIGEAKLIIKHSAPVNGTVAGRAQKISNIFIENSAGERFRYPLKHLNGARAMATHVSYGGNPYDSVGSYIVGLSEELGKLRKFKNYVSRNSVISEAMNDVVGKVADRVEAISKQLSGLQVGRKYTQFVESYTQEDVREIPEAIINDWVERLTIKTFNEELKSVFPYIYKLVEAPIVLEYSDIVRESDRYHGSKDVQFVEADQFQSFVEDLAGESKFIFSKDTDEQSAAVDKLNDFLSTGAVVGQNGQNAIQSLSQVFGGRLDATFKEFGTVDAQSSVAGIVRDFLAQYDSEEGTDISTMIEFGDIEDTEEPAQPETEPSAEPESEPTEMEPTEPSDEVPAGEPDTKQPLSASVGHRFAESLKRVIAKGAKPTDSFMLGEQQISIQDAIRMAGYKHADFFESEDADVDLVEYVNSMYNSMDGSFPKGETGVVLACQKKFGLGVGRAARNIIEKLQSSHEALRMRQLAGLQ